MKRLALLMAFSVGCLASGASAQTPKTAVSTNAPVVVASPAAAAAPTPAVGAPTVSVVSEAGGFLAPSFQGPTGPASRSGPTLAKPGKPNEIKGRTKTYSGMAVQVVKTKNPWQLINPFAPAEYGSGWDNAVRDIGTDRVVGLKVLAIGVD